MSPATPPTTAAAVTTADTAVSGNLRRHQPPQPRHVPPTLREDCWLQDETDALIDAWGERFLSLNRGVLRQNLWSEVAAAVNSAAHLRRNRRRTDAQCKNRIDTLKKRFKAEKAKLAADDRYVSPWPFFTRLDFLISGEKTSPDNSPPSPAVETPSVAVPSPPRRWPVKRRSAIRTRPARWLTEEHESDGATAVDVTATADVGAAIDAGEIAGGGWRMLAGAIKRVGEVYERVESTKQRRLIELEKHRMQFAMDLEYQRIKFFIDTQLHVMSSFKRAKLDQNHDCFGEDCS